MVLEAGRGSSPGTGYVFGDYGYWGNRLPAPFSSGADIDYFPDFMEKPEIVDRRSIYKELIKWERKMIL